MEPAAGQEVSGMVDIEVIATDESGISHVAYFIDGQADTTDSIAPYNYNWDTESVADDMEHIIAVVAYDSSGNSTLATPIAVYVDNFDNALLISPIADIAVFFASILVWMEFSCGAFSASTKLSTIWVIFKPLPLEFIALK